MRVVRAGCRFRRWGGGCGVARRPAAPDNRGGQPGRTTGADNRCGQPGRTAGRTAGASLGRRRTLPWFRGPRGVRVTRHVFRTRRVVAAAAAKPWLADRGDGPAAPPRRSRQRRSHHARRQRHVPQHPPLGERQRRHLRTPQAALLPGPWHPARGVRPVTAAARGQPPACRRRVTGGDACCRGRRRRAALRRR